jgi:hypothetical protein
MRDRKKTEIQVMQNLSRVPVIVAAIVSGICAFSAFHLWDLMNRSNDVWKLA